MNYIVDLEGLRKVPKKPRAERPKSVMFDKIYDNDSYRRQLIEQFVFQMKMQVPPDKSPKKKKKSKKTSFSSSKRI